MLNYQTKSNVRIVRALTMMNQGYGREDIGVKMGDCDFVDRLFASLRKHGQLLKQYGVTG